MTLATTVLSRIRPKSTDRGGLWVALAILAALDAATTAAALHVGLAEANPVIAALLDVFGPVALPASQAVYLGAAGVVVAVVDDGGERWVLGAGVLLSAVVVANNALAVLYVGVVA